MLSENKVQMQEQYAGTDTFRRITSDLQERIISENSNRIPEEKRKKHKIE